MRPCIACGVCVAKMNINSFDWGRVTRYLEVIPLDG
jgi:hypothetical protein